MLLPVAVALAVMSVVMWRIEANAFLGAIQDAMVKKGTLTRLGATLKALPLLFPLAVDISITFFFITLLGLSGGITGAVTALAMSNTASIFIAREATKARNRRAAAESPKATAGSGSFAGVHTPGPRITPTPYIPKWVDTYNKGFYGTLRWALDKAESYSK